MDWGLFDKSAGENKFLREEIVYSSTVSNTDRHVRPKIFSYKREHTFNFFFKFFRRIYLIVLEGKERHHLILRFSLDNSIIIVYFVKNLLTTRITTLPVDRRVIKSGHSLDKVFLK